MAYSHVHCGYCGDYLGMVHGHQRRGLMRKHFKYSHPKELAEMQKALKVLNDLQRKYSYHAHLFPTK